MRSWTGIALARTAPGDDGMQSRLSTYLHPLAGRPLVWHTVSSLTVAEPAAARLYLVGAPEINPEIVADFAGRLETISEYDTPADLELDTGPVLVVDAAAPTLGASLTTLLRQEPGTVLESSDGAVAAALLEPALAADLLRSGRSLAEYEGGFAGAHRLPALTEAVVVRDRSTLARATRVVRDRILERLMAGGATFLLPESVLVDVDVQIGRDTVVYPGVVIEGRSSIGEETVVGPGCRIIDSWIGSGVELKGWNFVSRSSVRNRAILEPYVRRGFD
jgi:hypothetical protein